MTTKKCVDCKEVKPTTEFFLNGNDKQGFKSYCKLCSNLRSNASHARSRKAKKLKLAQPKVPKFNPNILIAGKANVLFVFETAA